MDNPGQSGRRRTRTSEALTTSRGATSTLSSLASTALVAYGTYKVGEWAWTLYQKWNDEDASNMDGGPWLSAVTAPTSSRSSAVVVPKENWRRRREHMTQCRDRVGETLEGFLPTMKEIVFAKTEFQQATKELKKLRRVGVTSENESPTQQKLGNGSEESLQEQQEQLWDHIKVQSVTRMMTTAYAYTLVHLVLTVQVHLLGGRLFHQKDEQQSSDAYQTSHRLVLSHTFEYFFQRGLPSLIGTVERAVEEVLEDWNVLSAVDVQKSEWEKALGQIQSLLQTGGRPAVSHSGGNRRRSKPRSMLRFIMPPSSVQLDSSVDNDPMALSSLEETWDLLESPVMMDAQRECFQATFDAMRDQHWGQLFVANENAEAGTTGSTTTSRPLATILTQLKHTSNSFFADATGSDGSYPYLTLLESLPSVVELGDVSFG